MRRDEREMGQLPYLDTFSRAAELSSFTGAAKALRLTQAAVSQRMQALEKMLDCSLFKRQGGRVFLTEAGQRLYEVAQRILELHRRARFEVAGQETSVSGELLLAASSVPGEHLLPALLSVFGKQHPHIHVRAAVEDSKAVLAQVERGEVSLGLVGQKSPKPHLEYRHLAHDRLVVVTPPGHAFAKRKRLTVQQLVKQPLILREAGSGIRHCFEHALERMAWSLSDFRIALELGSNEAIKEAVLQGVGVAVLSVYAVQKEVHAKQLHALELTDVDCRREMHIVLDKRRVLPLTARLFLHFLESHPIEAVP